MADLAPKGHIVGAKGLRVGEDAADRKPTKDLTAIGAIRLAEFNRFSGLVAVRQSALPVGTASRSDQKQLRIRPTPITSRTIDR
jgi:hypothetical protein